MLIVFILHRLIESVSKLFVTYPSQLTVLETVCKAIIQAALTARSHSVTLDSDGLEVTTLLVGALSRVQWETQSVSLVRLACESVTRLSTLYYQMMHFNDILRLVASFLKMLFSKLSSENLIALGSSFPSDLPTSVYASFDDHGIHDNIRSLIALYVDMNETDFKNLLNVLHSFATAVPCSSETYSSDSSFFLLLFAGQHFSTSGVVQDALWSLLTTIITVYPAYSAEVTPDVLIPAIIPALTETTCNRTPLLNFLNDYASNACSPSREPLFVLTTYFEYPELLQVLLGMLDTTRELESQVQRDEVAAVSNLLELFFWKFKQSRSTINLIFQYRIVDILKQAALKWPELSCISYCNSVRQLLNHFPPNIVGLHPSLKKLMEGVPDSLVEKKDAFFSQNQFLPFVDLLCNPATLNSENIRMAIYDAIKFLLKSSPGEKKNEWLTDRFLKCYISSLPKDVKAFPHKLQVFTFVSHFIVYSLSSDRMQLIQEQGWHEVAINDCLRVADNAETRASSLGFATCILQGYSRSLKDISSFSDSYFSQWILDFATQHGVGIKSEAGETFGSVILTLTADKAASVVLHKKGFLDSNISLVADQYDPQVVRPAIHAIGNIALSGHHVKQEVLDKSFHITLIDYLRHNVSTADPGVLSASCRVLHILASGDWAKRKFAEEGLVDILMKMLETRRDNAEICWRPLGLLSSLGFMSLSNREYIITEKVLASVLNLLKTTKHSKVKSYTALVFLASIDSDRRSADLQRMKVTEIFQQVLQEIDSSDASFDDLQRWGSSLLEKGHLFTIPLNNTTLLPAKQQLLTNSIDQSISWPGKSYCVPKESVDSSEVRLLPTLDETNLAPQFPEAPKLTDDAISQIRQLGLDPDNLFRIGRFFGSTHGLCSNCEKEGRSEELSFRPQSLTPHQYQELITRGWYRRGGVKLFRYRYNHNLDCSDWETRVIVSEFDHRKHKSYKKVLKKMPEDRLTVETVPTQFISEAYDLYNSYHLVKHDKPLKSEYSYCEHAVNSPVRNQCVDGFQYGSFHQLYRLDGRLVAVGVIDVVPNGVVSTYMWYDTSKEISKYSFGVYSSLKEIEYTKHLSRSNPNIKYYYLQGWNAKNHKLSYKARYEPEEFLSPCTVSDWVLGVEGVKREQEKAKEKWILANHPTPSSDHSPVTSQQQNCVANDVVDTKLVPGDAFSLDLLKHEQDTGRNKPIVVCLNHQMYLHLDQMLDSCSISSHQRKLMTERFEELVLAVGPNLVQNMVVDLVACVNDTCTN